MIQSVLLSKKYFTFRKSLDWIKSNGFKSYKVDITNNFFRYRQFDPSSYKRHITRKSRTPGVEYIIEY